MDATMNKNADNGYEFQMGPLQFMPIHMVSTWRDPFTKDDRVAVAILLPSGVGERIDDISYSVDRGWVLEMEISWPSVFMNSDQLLKI